MFETVNGVMRTVDLRFLLISGFMALLTGWHVTEGTMFPDSVFFAALTVATLVLSVVGIRSEQEIDFGS